MKNTFKKFLILLSITFNESTNESTTFNLKLNFDSFSANMTKFEFNYKEEPKPKSENIKTELIEEGLTKKILSLFISHLNKKEEPKSENIIEEPKSPKKMEEEPKSELKMQIAEIAEKPKIVKKMEEPEINIKSELQELQKTNQKLQKTNQKLEEQKQYLESKMHGLFQEQKEKEEIIEEIIESQNSIFHKNI